MAVMIIYMTLGKPRAETSGGNVDFPLSTSLADRFKLDCSLCSLILQHSHCQC